MNIVAHSRMARKGKFTYAYKYSDGVRHEAAMEAAMREEMREYLANGNGTPRSFWRRLNERTAQEIQIYERTRRELEKETSEEVWEQKNDALRRLGLRTIPNPGE